jgi:hypothetical protein
MSEAAVISSGTWGVDALGEEIDARATISATMTSGTFEELLYQLTDGTGIPLDPTRGNDYNRFYAYNDPYDNEEVTFRIVGSLFNDVGEIGTTGYPDGRDDAWDAYVRSLAASETPMPYIELIFNLTSTAAVVVPDEPIVYTWEGPGGIGNGPLVADTGVGVSASVPELVGVTSAELTSVTLYNGATVMSILTVVNANPTANGQVRMNGNGSPMIRLGAGGVADWTHLIFVLTDSTEVRINRT